MTTPPPIPPETDLALRRYAIVMSYMGTECSMFWGRSQLFLVANAAIIGFLARDIPLPGAPHDAKLAIYLILSVAGLVLSILWQLMIYLGSGWISWWQQKLKSLEAEAFGSLTLWSERPPEVRLKTRSVARATATLFSVIWIALLGYILFLLIH